MNVSQFIDELFKSLGRSITLMLGGADLTKSPSWLSLLQTALVRLTIIIILVGLFWLLYRGLIFTTNRIAKRFAFKPKNTKLVHRGLKYFWYFASIIVVASQVGVDFAFIRSSVRAIFIGGLFYLVWVGSDHIIDHTFKNYTLNASIRQLIKNISSVLIIIFAIAALMKQFGFDLMSIVAGLGIVGLAVGFAAQSTLADFIAGVTILIEQPFQIGHWVRINDKEGKVDKIALRTTRIRTRDNVTIVIPNATVAAAEVTNLTARHLVRFSVNFGIAYEEDVAQAREVVLAAIQDSKFILKNPAPMMTVVGLDDSGINLILRYWLRPIDIDKQPRISETLLETVHCVLVEAGIEIPYPHIQLLTNKP